MPPRIIAGRYEVVRAVGRGGMGTVWLCRDRVLGREVAVKQVGAVQGESRSDLARALREARSSAALNSSHVVSVYDAVEDGADHWLVMEYVPGRSLAEVIAQEGPLDPRRVADIGHQAALGLSAAHVRGTVHRDVKPSNLLVTDDDHVKLTDFGISRTHGDVQLTQTGLITGTPAYLSPEIARGAEPGLPADVWALGATLYAAVEGHPPYTEQGNALALLVTIAQEPVPHAQRAGPLGPVLAGMLAREPATRWTMTEAAEALGRVARSEEGAPATAVMPPIAPPAAVAASHAAASDAPAGSGAPPTAGRPRRARWLVPAAALLVLLVMLGAGVLLLRPDESPVARQADPAPTSDAGPRATQRPSDPGSVTPSLPTGSSVPQPPAPEPTEEPDEDEPDEDEPDEDEPDEEGPNDVGAFALEYYSYLPGDTRSAYELLSSDYRTRTSYGQYRGFWGTVRDVEVASTTAVDATTVDVELTYVTDAGSEPETRRLYLADDGEGLVITDDTAL